jgi:hypothetical protein
VSFTLATASIPEGRAAPIHPIKIEPLQRREVQMVQRVKELVLQGIVIHEGIGNMAKAAETAIAQAEALIVELRRDTGDDLPPQPFVDNDEQ